MPPQSREIVGVVGDVRQDGVSRRPMAQMYAPYAQSTCGFASFFVRLDDSGSVAASSLHHVVSSVDPLLPVRAAVGAAPGRARSSHPGSRSGDGHGGSGGWVRRQCGRDAWAGRFALYETEPRDSLTFAATATLLIAIAAIATYIPAGRALATNPAQVIRTE